MGACGTEIYNFGSAPIFYMSGGGGGGGGGDLLIVSVLPARSLLFCFVLSWL